MYIYFLKQLKVYINMEFCVGQAQSEVQLVKCSLQIT